VFKSEGEKNEAHLKASRNLWNGWVQRRMMILYLVGIARCEGDDCASSQRVCTHSINDKKYGENQRMTCRLRSEISFVLVGATKGLVRLSRSRELKVSMMAANEAKRFLLRQMIKRAQCALPPDASSLGEETCQYLQYQLRDNQKVHPVPEGPHV
jgi:hypothetical protein